LGVTTTCAAALVSLPIAKPLAAPKLFFKAASALAAETLGPH